MEETKNEKTLLGFWIYLMTDLTMFAGLFAAYAVLRTNTFGGPPMRDIVNLPFVLIETLVLLLSSFTSGIAVLSATLGRIKSMVLMLCLTFLLGASFLGMELYEFHNLFIEGNTFQRSGFLSSYFGLVGTHGLHIFAGLIWLMILLVFVARKGLTKGMVRKLTLFGIFWHFLDIVWIFIFTFVYLMGAAL